MATLKILDQLDDKMDVRELMDEWIDETVIGTLHQLLDNNQLDPFKHDLKAVFAETLELGRAAESDRSLVCVDATPPVSDRAGWKEF